MDTAVAGAGGDRDRRRDRRSRSACAAAESAHGREDPAPDQRRAADAAAARLHHPVHLPDAGVDRARRDRRRCCTRSPVVVRLVEAGIRDVAPDAVEAAGAFGATRLQVLRKVKIPLARDAIMLGVNQGIIMVLAVVVIGGLVGSRRPRLRGRRRASSGTSSGTEWWRRSRSSRSGSRSTASRRAPGARAG